MSNLEKRWLSLETALLAFMIIVSLWFFLGSFTYSSDSAFFPQLSAGITLSLLILFLLIRLLPDRYRNLLQTNDEGISYGQSSNEEDDELNEWNALIICLLFAVYVLSAYVFGMIIATPPFIYVSQTYLGYGSKLRRIEIAAIMLIVVLGSYTILQISYTQGYIFNF